MKYKNFLIPALDRCASLFVFLLISIGDQDIERFNNQKNI